MLAKKYFILFSLVSLGQSVVHASYFPTPLATPDNSTNFVQLNHTQACALGITYEATRGGTSGFDDTDKSVSLGSMYSPSESFLTMLRSPRGAMRAKLTAAGVPIGLSVAPDFGGQRGAVAIDGSIAHQAITIGAATRLSFVKIIPGFLDLALYIPSVSKKFNVSSITRRPFDAVDAYDAQLDTVMRDIPDFLQRVGGLSSESWQGAGVGDPTLILRWNWAAHLAETQIRQLTTALYIGGVGPLGKMRDEDKVFSLPLGNNGHWGVPAGGSLELEFNQPIKVGVGFDILWQAPQSRLQRVKTDMRQTTLLLLDKAFAKLTPGLSWRTHWFVEGHNLWRGLSVRGMYECMVHHDDKLTTPDSNFSDDIINSAENLKAWNVHQLSGHISYNFKYEFGNAPVEPHIQLYYKLPVSGRRMVNSNTIGFKVDVRF
jgi:hypothetical protein